MRKISTIVVVSLVAAVGAGCALNPFAEDNIYKRKNSDSSASAMQQPSAPEINAKFENADADKNGVISKQEADKLPRLAAVFARYNSDRDGTLNWNEFTAAMQSTN